MMTNHFLSHFCHSSTMSRYPAIPVSSQIKFPGWRPKRTWVWCPPLSAGSSRTWRPTAPSSSPPRTTSRRARITFPGRRRRPSEGGFSGTTATDHACAPLSGRGILRVLRRKVSTVPPRAKYNFIVVSRSSSLGIRLLFLAHIVSNVFGKTTWQRDKFVEIKVMVTTCFCRMS